jgi:hypothetical protein
MYHPRSPAPESPYLEDDLEFVEIQNIDDQYVDLAGFRIAGAIRYELASSAAALAPGGVLVVARNPAAFLERYPSAPGILVGPYEGALANSRETIRLEGPSGEPILEFEYRDSWYIETDGDGYSLIVVDAGATPESWQGAASWRPSLAMDGSPGIVESGPGLAGGLQIPGNVNRDLNLDISDAIALLFILFHGDGRPLPCGGTSISEGGNRTVADSNGDGLVDISDVVHLLSFLFQSGEPPARGRRCIRIDGCPDVCPP